MSRIIFAIVMLTVLISCKEKQNTQNVNDQYSLKVIDTFKIKHNGNPITRLLDYNKKEDQYLFSNETIVPDTIFQVNATGKIINKFYFNGGSETEVGKVIFNIAYYKDDTILVNSNRGFYFYDLDGNFIKSIKDETSLKGYGAWQTDIVGIKGKDSIVALQLKDSFGKFVDLKEFYRGAGWRYLTFYNLEKGTYETKFEFEKESIFLKEDFYYGNMEAFFDYNEEQLTMSILHNADPKLYVYDQKTDFNSYEVVNLDPEHFKLPFKFEFKPEDFDEKAIYINSQYQKITHFGAYTLVTYATGLPIEKYNAAKSYSEVDDLYITDMKYYSIVLKNNKKISHDIELPKGGKVISFAKSIDHIFVETNADITEQEEGSVFYICKLVSP